MPCISDINTGVIMWAFRNCHRTDFYLYSYGQAGLNWEHSMLDGHTMMEYYAEVMLIVVVGVA